MKVTELTASRTARINLGDYESTDVFLSMKGEVEEGEDLTEARNELAQLIESSMVVQVHAAMKARGKEMSRDQIIKRFGFGRAK